MKKCDTKYCKNRTKRAPFCASCAQKKWRLENPVKYAYSTLKNNAKRRKKIFEISFEYFKAFCVKTGYLKNKGIRKELYTVDRIEEELGYIEGNIRCIKNEDNLKKYLLWKYDYDEFSREMVFTGGWVTPPDTSDVPF